LGWCLHHDGARSPVEHRVAHPSQAEAVTEMSEAGITPTKIKDTIAPPAARTHKIVGRRVNFYYGKRHSLKDVDIEIADRKVTAIIGPSGCGKSTLLRIFNRIYGMYPNQTATGEVLLDGRNILDPRYPLNRLRTKIGIGISEADPFSYVGL
jgi:phosphate transport system ATP-binding protein